MNLICKKQYKVFEGVIDVGDIVEISTTVTDREKVVSKKRITTDDNLDTFGNKYTKSIVVNDVVIPKGSYTGFRITTKTGLTFRDWDLICNIGYIPLSEMFDKA